MPPIPLLRGGFSFSSRQTLPRWAFERTDMGNILLDWVAGTSRFVARQAASARTLYKILTQSSQSGGHPVLLDDFDAGLAE